LYSDARSRPALAHWVVDQVSGPSERAVGVQIIVRTAKRLPDTITHATTRLRARLRRDPQPHLAPPPPATQPDQLIHT